MDEKRTDYEPNFIMSGTTESMAEAKAEENMQPQDVNQPYGGAGLQNDSADIYKAAQNERTDIYERAQNERTDIYEGAPKRQTGVYERLSDEQTGTYEEAPGRQAGACEGARTYSSATWTSSGHSSNRGFETGRQARAERNAERKFRRKANRKPSAPVTLTRRSLGFIVAGCLVFSALFGLGGAYIGSGIWNDDGGNASVSTTSGSHETTGYSLESATGSNMTVKEITEAVQGSVVEIRTESTSSDSWLQDYVTEGAGSGVIISKDGYIMTNNHVISGASKITVTTANDKSYEAKLIGTDSTNDVAVIKIKADNLTPVTFGNSDQLQVGDLAVAIGNPLGELGGTVTAGIISATDRQLTIDGTTMTLLQTDSSINPGNSGGGLFNGDGQLVGLVVAKSSGSDVEGLGFAIPVNKAADVANQLMDKGYVSDQPWTGMTYTEGSSGFDSFFGETSGGTVYIYSVDTAKSKLAGFKAGDVVYAIDGEEISSIDDISGVITAHKVGDKVTFTVLRDGQAKDIKLVLQEKSKEQLEEQNSQE